jgi:hypothetical protein
MGSEPRIARYVFRVVDCVLAAVNFQYQAMFLAHKINNVLSNWYLPTKAQLRQAMGADGRPKMAFGIGHIATESLRPLAMPIGDNSMCHTPLPAGSAGRPPPQGGRCKICVAPHPLRPPAKVGKSSGLKP